MAGAIDGCELAAPGPDLTQRDTLPRRRFVMREATGAAPGEPAQMIVAVAVRQDRTAFAALFAHYAPRIKAMLMRMGVDAGSAEDIAQDTMVAIWRKAALFDASRASASAWIFAIARNLRIDRLRRDNRARMHEIYELVEPEEPERPDSALAVAESGERVQAAMKHLSAEQLHVVTLSFFEGRSHGDIAARLGLPLGTVKSRLRLAMARLREHLGDLS
ncbi:MAG: sigma-70 family RNA polymerase sigma factor [Pseudolabrys sp.]